MQLEQDFLTVLRYARTNPYDMQAAEDAFEIIKALENVSGGYDIAHRNNKIVREHSAKMIRQRMSIEDLGRAYELYKKTLFFDAQIDFDAYMLYLEFDREPEAKFYSPRRRVLRPIVQDMQDLVDDKLDLLAISLPPGTGKSTLSIFLLSWLIGRWPHNPNLASAHSGTLTRSFYDGVMQVVIDPDYLWQDVFPGSYIAATNAKDETIDIMKPHRFNSLTCRAIGATLTGATRCEKLLYADDLCSGIEEALSKDRMDTLWRKYTNDLKTRKKMKCKELHVATRWSIHDVIGRLEEQYGNDPRSKFVSMPALNETNESNFDYEFNVGFNTKYFYDIKESMEDAEFEALFQQSPYERKGRLYGNDEIRRYLQLPQKDGKDMEPDAIIGLCDPKEKGSDYAALPIAYQYGDDYYIVDCLCNNGKLEVVIALMVEILLKHNVQLCRFESNSAGGQIGEKVQEKIRERVGRTYVTTKYTTENKETKIIVNSVYVKQRFLFKDESLYSKKSEYGQMMKWLFSYTMTGKNKHDDVPDAMAMLALFVQSLKNTKVEVVKRPF